MTKKITLTNQQVLNLRDYMEGDNYCFDSKNNTIKPNISWPMFNNKKVIKELSAKVEEALDEIRSKYNNDEMAYDVKDENGNDVRREVKPEYIEQFSKEMNELAAQENEIEVRTIQLSKIEDLSIDDRDFEYISLFIEDDDSADYVID